MQFSFLELVNMWKNTSNPNLSKRFTIIIMTQASLASQQSVMAFLQFQGWVGLQTYVRVCDYKKEAVS